MSIAQQGTSDKLLHELYERGPAAAAKISRVIEDAFEQQQVVLDYASLSHLRLRIGKGLHPVEPDPRLAKPQLEHSAKLDDQGDGIRAFTGIVTALFAVQRDVFLIDEPELFLHPPQAVRIGELIARQESASRQCFVATHSADVLRGILCSSQRVDVVRIDRRDTGSTFNRLDPNRLQEIMKDPLLSSARVLEGVFYKGVVVVESDADARFYQFVSRKMAPGLDLHFVNADNKQTVPKILAVYRELGIPCAGIVDIDVLNDAQEFQKHLDTISKEPAFRNQAATLREAIANGLGKLEPADRVQAISAILSETGSMLKRDQPSPALIRKAEAKLQEALNTGKPWQPVKKSGRSAFPEAAQTSFDRLAELCGQRGLFINSCGELEAMLAEYGIPWTNDKRDWVVRALTLLPNLMIDRSKQPWKLVAAVHEHLTARPQLVDPPSRTV